jgi:hypothetical protein
MTGRSLSVEMRTETCPLFAFAKRADKFLGGYVRSSELRSPPAGLLPVQLQ